MGPPDIVVSWYRIPESQEGSGRVRLSTVVTVGPDRLEGTNEGTESHASCVEAHLDEVGRRRLGPGNGGPVEECIPSLTRSTPRRARW
jgi:hypothetical protein